MFKIGTIVRHFKGDLYLILCYANHSENKEKLVIYKALYGDGEVWARPIDLFYSEVPKDKINPTNQKFRFEEYIPKRISTYELND